MNKEEKELLLVDLCARMPYHVRVKVWLADGDTEEGPLDLQHNYGDVLLDAFYYNKITKIKPYLRPMSSMTREERQESRWYQQNAKSNNFIVYMNRYVEWLDSNHFDWRTDGNDKTMIELGLAIEAPEGMYEIK